ncbi:bifunctional diguanylate cyclase/phosphodiesterase [Motiliproteus sp. SC1-56]|uniref:putative bifunctional diguanylate cyclase/phosphodiesterase n=1 Tax=Motiliproteus sp. SC1-56 TaxID=2799565 RepID=UPI001A8FFB63|nr:bifunctional diguanylate cyclase/phosphodiesterase [Motiliproteus sp. SC1-56]
MPSKNTRFRDWWSRKPDTFAGSRLVWGMILVILLLWTLNVRELVLDYRERAQERVTQYQVQLLGSKAEELEDRFLAVYEHIRTISLLPSVRAVSGPNRQSTSENVVYQGRLPLETHYTLEQIYRNLANSISLSEIYYVLDGFRPDRGEVPFFMYDGEIVGVNDPVEGGLSNHGDIPEEYELDEYAYYLEQMRWYKAHFPRWSFSDDITQIPALASPLMRTCDNTQYASVSGGSVEDTHGILYSVPVFGLDDKGFKGIISAVLRANVLEAALVGVPFIPITPDEQARAREEAWALPPQPADFLLTQDTHDIVIHDRRNSLFAGLTPGRVSEALSAAGGRGASVTLDVVGEGRWRLYHHLPPARLQALTDPLRHRLYIDIAARVGLLLVLLAIFLRANRDQRRHHAELVKLAHYDSLTHLPNRSLLYLHLQKAMARADRHKRCLGLMFVDIDDFGNINDSLGHQAGDAVLMAIAERLRQSVRLTDEVARLDSNPTVARIGGDDFALVFEDVRQPEDGVFVGERLMLQFQEPINLDGQKSDISISGGMAIYPDDATDIDELMASADQALRHAAERGMGQFQMFNDTMRQRAARQSRMMRDLPDAVRHGLFTLHYQAKQSLADDEVVSFEALLRWHHEEYGNVSPVEFIPLLEQSGLIVEAGRWVLETACRQLSRWHQEGYTGLSVSVNVSPRQLMLSDIVATVDKVLAETRIPPQTLILEITESMVIDNLEEGSRTLERLRGRGVRLAIDDFGTGYSSLTYLQGLPADYLKLDKSMIDVISDERGAHVIRTTIELARGLGLMAIAEGVEHAEQREALKKMGCDMIQGFWLSRPLPVEKLTAFLARHCRRQSTACAE